MRFLRRTSIRSPEHGLALIVVLMAMLLMSALGAASVMTTSAETMIASNYRGAEEGFYAADAGLGRALIDLDALTDWGLASTGLVWSTFIDAGVNVDPRVVANVANCGRTTDCTAADLARVTSERPWGPNNPEWHVYAYGRLSQIGAAAPAAGGDAIESPYSVVVLVTGAANGALALRSEAFAAGNRHQRTDLTVARSVVSMGLRLVSWRQIR